MDLVTSRGQTANGLHTVQASTHTTRQTAYESVGDEWKWTAGESLRAAARKAIKDYSAL